MATQDATRDLAGNSNGGVGSTLGTTVFEDTISIFTRGTGDVTIICRGGHVMFVYRVTGTLGINGGSIRERGAINYCGLGSTILNFGGLYFRVLRVIIFVARALYLTGARTISCTYIIGLIASGNVLFTWGYFRGSTIYVGT